MCIHVICEDICQLEVRDVRMMQLVASIYVHVAQERDFMWVHVCVCVCVYVCVCVRACSRMVALSSTVISADLSCVCVCACACVGVRVSGAVRVSWAYVCQACVGVRVSIVGADRTSFFIFCTHSFSLSLCLSHSLSLTHSGRGGGRVLSADGCVCVHIERQRDTRMNWSYHGFPR